MGTTSRKKVARDRRIITPARPGVINTILNQIEKPKGATIPEIVRHLSRRFPDRDPTQMTNTARTQVAEHARKRRREGVNVRYFA